MKILMLFIDMLGGEYMHICNEKAEINPLDNFFVKLGGTIHTNCYTPAPDTPRSSACMWSGLYPKANGCNTRVKWPKRDLKPEVNNLWKVLHDLDYTVNVYLEEDSKDLGLIPFYGNEHIYSETIYQFLNNAEITDNSFNFIYLPDMHNILNEVLYSASNMKVAIDYVVFLLEEIFSFFENADIFDYLMILSDHGFKNSDADENCQLTKTRVHSFLLERYSGDNKLIYDRKLRSNLDVFPTICERVGYSVKNHLEGKLLSNPLGHEHVLLEDMDGFSTSISQTVEHWGVITSNGDMHWLECDGKWSHSSDGEGFDDFKYLELIKEKMTGYSENHRMYATMALYRKYLEKESKRNCYSTGEKFWRTMFKYENEKELSGKRIVVYGAGRVGCDYYNQFVKNPNCILVGWIDMNYMKLKNTVNNRITGISSLFTLNYNIIVIAIDNYEIADTIRQMLIDLNVDSEKIVWKRPLIVRVEDLA